MKNQKPEKVYYINSKDVLGRAIRVISSLEVRSKDPYAIKVYLDTESRSIKQNRLAFLLYKELGVATGHGMIQERYRCKLEYGLPLLMNDPDFCKFYDNTMLILSYEEKIQCMGYVPITSLFKMNQFAEYLNMIYQESAAQGTVLSKPEDLYYAALMLKEDVR